jgi:enoyl-CoA hydratase/carnithine racemase
MEFEKLLIGKKDGIVTLTMNNPQTRNALSLKLITELTAALSSAASDSEARVVIIKGNGPAFSSGHDLRELIEGDTGHYRRVFAACGAMMNLVHQIPQPVIAQVHGAAFAAGCQLVATCDLAVASMEARFSTPGVKLGLFCNTPSVPLTRCIGRKKALDMLLTGRVLTAEEAEALGLVSRVVAPDRLEAEVLEMAQAIAASSPLTVRFGKEFFYKQIEMDEYRALEYATEVMVVNLQTQDAQHGIKAFLEKKQPAWKGK